MDYRSQCLCNCGIIDFLNLLSPTLPKNVDNRSLLHSKPFRAWYCLRRAKHQFAYSAVFFYHFSEAIIVSSFSNSHISRQTVLAATSGRFGRSHQFCSNFLPVVAISHPRPYISAFSRQVSAPGCCCCSYDGSMTLWCLRWCTACEVNETVFISQNRLKTIQT